MRISLDLCDVVLLGGVTGVFGGGLMPGVGISSSEVSDTSCESPLFSPSTIAGILVACSSLSVVLLVPAAFGILRMFVILVSL